jgi:hypothetical protein
MTRVGFVCGVVTSGATLCQRVQNGNTCGFVVGDVASDNGEAVHRRGRCDLLSSGFSACGTRSRTRFLMNTV